MIKRTFVIGDIHGCYKALVQCLERSQFNYEEDTLISLGDIVDGWSEVYECVEHLLTIRNLIVIQGNHDEWFKDFLSTGGHPTAWNQGGKATAESYLRNQGEDRSHLIRQVYNSGRGGYIASLYPDDIPPTHHQFYKKMIPFHIKRTEEEYYCFVHGGFDRDYLIDYQHPSVLMWDRELWQQAQSCKGTQKLKNADDFSCIFIGHTHVDDWRNPEAEPMNSGGVYNIDTGAGWSGRLTIMNVDTKQYWQSDFVQKLYPDETGRR